jgi:hypothetical protein
MAGHRIQFALLAFALANGGARADFIVSNYGSATPEGAWAYSTRPNVGKGNSTTYIPFRPDWAGLATFQGYVNSDAIGGWNNAFSGENDADTIYVFQTYVRADTTVTIPMFFTGDDGHALYVNDTLVASGPFGTFHLFDLVLAEGTPVKLEIADYNGPGPMGTRLQRLDNLLKIESVPGITIDALEQFPAVPEPSSAGIFLGGGLLLAAYAVRGMRRRVRLNGPKGRSET